MLPLLTADEMRAAERQAIQGWGIPSLILQEHAALGALALLPPGEPLTVLAGPGNNGGDALALARLARLQGRMVRVHSPLPQPLWQGDGAIQAALWKGLGGEIQTLASSKAHIEEAVRHADLLIGGVLIPGAAAPKLVTRDMVKQMKKGSVIVDVAIDQGGCVETAHATTHSNPVYEVDGVVHYCVANMPGAVPRTSTIALTNATLPYTRLLANRGFERAVRENAGLAEGVNVYKGEITYEAVATSQGRKYTALAELL